jgi:hypothetical protein
MTLPLLPCGHRTRHGKSVGCCAGCRRLFSSDYAFARHRRGGQCLDPAERGLVERPSTSAPGESIWGSPSPDKPLDYLPNPSREGVTPSARSSIPALPHHRGG